MPNDSTEASRFGAMLDRVRGQRVLVAGGAGFVGSAVVRELLELGACTIVLDNFFHGSPDNLTDLAGDLTVIEGDARDLAGVRRAVQGARPDHIINCIGDTYVPTAYSEPGRFFDVNVGCNLNLLLAARQCAVHRFLYVSSTEVYGSVAAARISEQAPLAPVNTYAVSKTSADRLCYTFYLEHGLPIVIARLFNCYGPRESHPYVIPEIIAQFARGRTLRLGNLAASRDFTYVEDTARALIALLTSCVADGESVNVGSDVSFSVEWLARRIGKEMGIECPEIQSHHSRLRMHDIDSFRCNNAKLRQLTGWQPKVEIGEGLCRTIDWYIKGKRRWSWEERTNDVSVGVCGPPRTPLAELPRPDQPDEQPANPRPSGIVRGDGGAIADLIPVGRPFLWGNELERVREALQRGWVSSRGPVVEEFEAQFARRVGRSYAVAVSNGTAAVHLALESLRIGHGDEVIVPDFCMIAPVFALMYAGAVPVPVDVDETWNLDPPAVAAAITPRTRAILVVHNYGHPAAMHKIVELARAHGIPIIEDAAEVLGATVLGRPAGSFGEVACYSFYANKLITTGEGGMVVTDDAELHRRAKWKRDMCFGGDEESRFLHREIGFNYRLTSLQAAVGLAQLDHFDEALRSKIEIAQRYHARLARTRGLQLPSVAGWATHSYWVYGIVAHPAFGVTRGELQRQLAARGIETRRFFSPVHEQPLFSPPLAQVDCPRAQYLSQHGLYLPSYIGMSPSLIDRVVHELHDIQSRGTMTA
jgi:perosamine synthetase